MTDDNSTSIRLPIFTRLTVRLSDNYGCFDDIEGYIVDNNCPGWARSNAYNYMQFTNYKFATSSSSDPISISDCNIIKILEIPNSEAGRQYLLDTIKGK